MAGYTGPVILDCYDSQDHDDVVTVADATNTSATVYRHIRSAAGCATPWAGKAGTGANFSSASVNIISLRESNARLSAVYCESDGSFNSCTWNNDGAVTVSGISANVKVVDVVASFKNSHATPGEGSAFCAVWSQASMVLFYNCIGLDSTGGHGFALHSFDSHTYAINCVALNNRDTGFAANVGWRSAVWNCYAADNPDGDFGAGLNGVTGWNASKDNSAPDIGGGEYKRGIDLIALGKMNAFGLALADDLFATGGAGDRYGRNPYDDVPVGLTVDFSDFLKNDTAGDPLSLKDIRGTDRPNAAVADSSWNVGASQALSGKGWNVVGVLDPAKVGGVALPAKGAGV